MAAFSRLDGSGSRFKIAGDTWFVSAIERRCTDARIARSATPTPLVDARHAASRGEPAFTTFSADVRIEADRDLQAVRTLEAGATRMASREDRDRGRYSSRASPARATTGLRKNT
jgi:hypothetical protein